MTEKDSFILIPSEEVASAVKVLKSRLPYSGNIYNMALCADKFTQEMNCYSWKGSLDTDAVIMITFTREDYGQDINISIPEETPLSEELRQGLASTPVIHWKGPHLFVGLDRRISTAIFEIDTKTYRNSVIFNPTYTYWMSGEDAEKFETEDKDEKEPSIVVKSLDKASGLSFFNDHWRSKRPGSGVYIRKMIDNLPSAGVYVNGELVSGAVVSGYGFIGPIITAGTRKRHGYATIAMQYLLKAMAQEGLCPVSSSAQRNYHYVGLHEKLGMTLGQETDWIFHTGVADKKEEVQVPNKKRRWQENPLHDLDK